MANTSDKQSKGDLSICYTRRIVSVQSHAVWNENSPATFQRLVNSLISNLAGCKAYVDDAIIFREEWEQLLQTIRNFFDRLSEATLTVNLTKSEFCHANLTFLGHMVGQGQVKPVEA